MSTHDEVRIEERGSGDAVTKGCTMARECPADGAERGQMGNVQWHWPKTKRGGEIR